MAKPLATRTPGRQSPDLPFASVATATPAPLAERRDLVGCEARLHRVLAEFTEMPGLALTLQQAARLFGLSTDLCAGILSQHIRQGRLRLTTSLHYTLAPHSTHS